MVFHEDEEKEKEEGVVSEDALEEVLDEDEDDDAPAVDVPEEEKDWA
jgi:hypothetical protein